MLHHLVLFELSDSATDADRDAIIDGLESMPAVVPEIQSYTVGATLPSPNASWSIALIGVFASVDDYKSYSANPVPPEAGRRRDPAEGQERHLGADRELTASSARCGGSRRHHRRRHCTNGITMIDQARRTYDVIARSTSR